MKPGDDRILEHIKAALSDRYTIDREIGVAGRPRSISPRSIILAVTWQSEVLNPECSNADLLLLSDCPSFQDFIRPKG